MSRKYKCSIKNSLYFWQAFQ